MMRGNMNKRLSLLAALCFSALSLSGCANVGKYQSTDEDPLQPLNRVVYQFNYTVDGVVLRPITMMYRGIVPEQGRTMVSNFLSNIYSPVVLANSILQGDPYNSFATLWRFIINSTVGVAGLFDAASEVGLKNRSTGFGDTMAMYGLETGPYLVLPLVGPSNFRDGFGLAVDAFSNPFIYIDQGPGLSLALWGATAIDQRSQNFQLLDDIYGTSLDPYTTFRSGYTQKRAADVRRAKMKRDKSLEDAGFK